MSKWRDAVALLAVALFTLPVVLFMYALGGFFLAMYGVLFPWQVGDLCVTDTSVKVENIGGFDFEFEDVNCDVIAKYDVQMVFVSRHGQHQRYRLAVYVPSPFVDPPRAAVATLLGARTIRLSLGEIDGMYTADDRWRDLRVTYDYSLRKRAQ
jgi:pimeloyl-ACP methyl ester carboxylesterase